MKEQILPSEAACFYKRHDGALWSETLGESIFMGDYRRFGYEVRRRYKGTGGAAVSKFEISQEPKAVKATGPDEVLDIAETLLQEQGFVKTEEV